MSFENEQQAGPYVLWGDGTPMVDISPDQKARC